MRDYNLIDCPSCGGEGYIDGWQQCSECDGLRKIFIPCERPRRRRVWLGNVISFVVLAVVCSALAYWLAGAFK